MKRLDIDQNGEAWFDFRRGKIGGSKVKGIKPLKTGKKKGLVDSAVGVWKIVAERLSIAKDGEPERDRGHRLEELAMNLTNKKYDLMLIAGKVWQSDEDENLYISPDCEEDAAVITYAQETKAFDSDKHLQIIYNDIFAKKLDGYNPINSLPEDNKDQAIDYFVKNEKLQKLYWTLIDDRQAYEEMEHYCIIINRKDVEGDVELLKDIQKRALSRINEIVEELKKELIK